MKLGRLAQRAKQVIDQRGGSDALKKDADELRDIARGGGSLQDKAKKAAQALKEPGAASSSEAPPSGSAPGGAPAPTDTPPPPTAAPPREQAPTDTPEGPPGRSST